MKRLAIGLASEFWSLATALVRLAVEVKILKPILFKSRVISVGNIQAGGAGKTPLVAQIAKEANSRGLRTCILTRGYRSPWENQGGVIVPGEAKIRSQVCGDEAALLHELCPGAYIGVGANRIRQFERALEKSGFPFDLILLDDGFQNWKIKKDLEIVALTSAHRTETPFRDWRCSLRKADLLVWTKGEDRPKDFGKPLVRIRYQLPPSDGNQPYLLVTGIADGKSAYDLAVRSGYSIRRHIELADHESYDEFQVKRMIRQATEENCKIALTGKDWVKWRDLGVNAEEVCVLEPKLIFDEGQEVWSQILWGK